MGCFIMTSESNSNRYKEWWLHELTQIINDMRLPEPTIDFYTIILFKMLDFSFLNEAGKICLYFDDFMKQYFAKVFRCSEYCVKRYITYFVNAGLLNSVSRHGEYKAIYYLNRTLSEHIINTGFNMKAQNLNLQLQNDNIQINRILSDADISVRAQNLFHLLAEHMIFFVSIGFFDEVKNQIQLFSPKFIRGVNSRRKKYQTNTAGIASTDFDYFMNKCYVFITPNLKKSIMGSPNYGYKASSLYEDLACLCNKRILVKTSDCAYRYFLNPDYPHDIIQALEMYEEPEESTNMLDLLPDPKEGL